MKKAASILVVIFATAFLGCEKSEWLHDGDYFFLENKGAVMPIWVKGNIQSGHFLVTVHGGPGGGTSGHEFPLSKGFQMLEKDYAIVYWDQRMAGMSQGNPNWSDMTIEQHIEDLDKVVQLIKSKYSPKSLFLLGHSWGGVMTGGYLGDTSKQKEINGWIDLDGSIYADFEVVQMKNWVLERIPEAYDRDTQFYQFIIDWYEENPTPKSSDPYQYWAAAGFGAYAYDWELTQQLSPIPYSKLVFSSPFTFAFYWSQYYDTKWADDYDVRGEVKQIEIPALVLFGSEDGIVTKEVAQYTFDMLPSKDKRIVLIDKCAHSPHYDSPQAFYDAMSSFMEAHKTL